MYKTIWDKRVHLLLSAISTACRGLRWQQDLIRKILSFTYPYPYGIDLDWGILEMLGEHQIKLEKGTNRAQWKDVARLWSCNKRKCFPVHDYMTECGDLSITVKSSNEALSKKERQQMARALALVETCERQSRAVSDALDMALELYEKARADPSS